MAFINEKTVNTEFLQGNNVILAGLVIELFEPCFKALLCLFHLLYGKVFSIVSLCFFNTTNNIINLFLNEIYLPFNADRYLLKLRMTDDNGVVISRSNLAAEGLSVLRFKVLFGSDKDICRGIER